MVSIIVPVYNVEKYIDQCLESIVNQTYTDIQILIMEAKSTDQSLEKCINWARKDDRIIIVSRKDGGLGPGRNYGINLAEGDYIVFVDSDDWLAEDFVEKTVKIAETDSEIDIVQGRVIIYDEGEDFHEQLQKDRLLAESYQNYEFVTIEEKKRCMTFGDNSSWGKLYRSSLWKKYGIQQPKLPYEDLAVYASLIAMSRKVRTCYQTGIFYRADREGSLLQSADSYKLFPSVVEYCVKDLKRLQVFDIYQRTLKYMMYRHLFFTVSRCVGIEGFNNLGEYSKEMDEYRKRFFSEYLDFTWWVIGGFSLRWIAHRFVNGKTMLSKHFAFTSIIAQMTQGEEKTLVKHKERIRQDWINGDILGFNMVERKPNIILIDFMQECKDVYELEDGNYITDTDALHESTFDMTQVINTIKWESHDFWLLWKEKCQNLIMLLESEFADADIFLVKNYLADSYWDHNKFVKYNDSVLEKNHLIGMMYDYMQEHMKDIIVIEYDGNNHYTDVDGQGYAASPEYLNAQYYDSINQKISMMLFG